MNKRRKFLVALFSILILPVLVFFAMTRNALALDEASINAKATFEGVYQCFNSGAYASSWKATELFSSFVTNAGNSDAVKLPYKKTNADNNNLNCDEVMLGQGHKASSGVQGGLLTDSARKTSEASSVAKYFAGNSLDGNGGLGYDATSDVGAITGNGKKLTYSITSNNTCYNSSAKPTLSLNGGSISEIVFPTIANSDNKITINNTGINVPVPGSKETYTYEACDHTTIKITDEGDSSSIKYRVSASGSGTYESSGMEWLPYSRFTITAKTTKDGVEYSADNFNTGSQMNITLSPNVSTEYESTSSYSNEYTLNRVGNVMSFLKGVNNNNRLGYNISNLYSGYNYLALTRQEVYDLYKYYANDVLHMQITCEGDSDYTSYENGGATINWKGGGKRCVIKNNGNTIPDDLYGVDDSYHFTAKITSVDDIRKTLNSLGDLCNPKLNGVEGCDGSSNSSSSGTTSSSDRYTDGFCDDVVDENGGIGSMQWILCPTLDNTTYTANWIDNLAEKYLEVDPGMYANEELKGKWEIIRNITNIAMVVFFMIIIGSQITGYGIDNYGIKKMLPRLIVMAIIINLSFYICTLAIDVSNILGEGLRDLFGAGSDGGTDGFVNVIMGLFGIGATGGAAAAGAATTAITLFGGGWIVLVIAVIVLVVVVIAALVVLLIMLGAREVIIVFCVISSPLAFAAFILPNTQNIFKKWWELFKAAIIIFPICGFVAGISAMLKDIDSMQMSDWGRLVMVVLPYLVFFLLPLLLKQALAALGKIGGALTAAGSTIKNGGKAIGRGAAQVGKNTERFKDWSQQAAVRRAKKTYNSLHGRNGLSRYQQERLRKAQDTLAAQHNREVENREQTKGNYLQAVQSKQDLAADQGVKDTLIYNNADFVEAERKLGRSNRKNKVEDTLLYNDKDYVAGESALRDLSRENKKDTTTFYIKTPGLLKSKKRQFEAQREAELRKMYSEKLANQSVDTKQKAFDAALKGVDTASVEETDAAFDALMATGDIEKILNTINTADFVGMKSEVRDRVIQKMLSSGDAVMKGFAKSLLKNPSTPMNFKDFVSTGGLANYLNKEAGEHGLDTASKDTLEFLAGDASRTVGIDKKIIANASISAANQNQKAADAMAKIITNSGQKDAIGAEINSKGLTNMNGTVARAYGRTALTPAITDIQKPGNEQILSNVGRETRTELGI